MPEYDSKMSGMLFKNKSSNPKAPVLKGFFEDENGQRYEVACWVIKDRETHEPKLDKNGERMLSVRLSFPEQKEDEAPF